MLSAEERTQRARTAAHAMWARIHDQLRDPDTADQHRAAAEFARRKLALAKAERAVSEAQKAAEAAAAAFAGVAQ